MNSQASNSWFYFLMAFQSSNVWSSPMFIKILFINLYINHYLHLNRRQADNKLRR